MRCGISHGLMEDTFLHPIHGGSMTVTDYTKVEVTMFSTIIIPETDPMTSGEQTKDWHGF